MERKKQMKCWIVCRTCDDPYYAGHPIGVVFTDKAKAESFIKEKYAINTDPDNPEWDDYGFYLHEGEIK